MDVAAEHELRACVREGAQNRVSMLERELPRRAPRRPGEVMVADDDAERACRCSGERVACTLQALGPQPAALVPPGTGRVEPADDGALAAEDRIGRPEDGLEDLPGPRRARDRGVRNVVVARDRERRRGEAVEERLRLLELRAAAAIAEVAACDHELGPELVTECHESVVERGIGMRAPVQVGDVDRARGHRRTRLYTRSGVRAVARDLRRPLPGPPGGRRHAQEAAWRGADRAGGGRAERLARLSVWRKVLAIGAFSFGTFGLGFTLGGLIFGRRRAKA